MIPISRPNLGEEEIQAVTALLRKGELAHGPTVEKFEEEFAYKHHSVHPGVAVSSGTAALELLLRASGIGPGDEVIVPSFSFFATASAVIAVGAKPVFADVDPTTFLITVETAERVRTEKTSALLLVHLYGRMAPVREFQGRYALILEDACQAHRSFLGERYGTYFPGTESDGAAFSFYPTKNMTTIEGGMVLSRHRETRDRVRLLRNHGMSETYKHELIGGNYRMTSIGAAIGLEQLKKLEAATRYRQHLASIYQSLLSQHAESGALILPEIIPGHVFNQYTVRVPVPMKIVDRHARRDRIVSRLNELGVGARVYYRTPIHRQPVLEAQYGHQVLDGTQQACDEVMSLPMYAGLSLDDHEKVVSTLDAVLKEFS